MQPKIERSEVEAFPVKRPPEGKSSPSLPVIPETRRTRRTPPPPPPLMRDGRAMFKVVVVGYAGVCNAMHQAKLNLPAGARETWQKTTDSGWTFCSYNFVLEEKRWDSHPIHLHVFGHEGLGFVGQPGSSRDVVFKNAHAVFALAKGREDTDNSASALEGDLTRLHSQGTWPLAEVVMTPDGHEPPALAQELWKARTLDWPTDLATVFATLPDLLQMAQGSAGKL